MKIFVKQIPPARLLYYAAAAAIFLIIALGYSLHSAKKNWLAVSNQIKHVHRLHLEREKKQSLNKSIRKKYDRVDEFYLEHNLEQLNLLNKERESLLNLTNNQNIIGNEWIDRRSRFISGNSNKIHFTTDTIAPDLGIQDSIKTTCHPVEADSKDLEEILKRVEGEYSSKPLLLITDFLLKRKNQNGGNETFELTLTLLKREFVS